MAARKKTSKKSAKKATAKKESKITKLSQAHGKKEEFLPSTLDQIWGDTGSSKYKTLDIDVYTEQLNDYHRVDLQAHAVKIGLIPIDNIEQLKKRLLTEFRKHVSQYKIPAKKVKKDKPLSKEAMKILGEGK